jgi:hypothetical protein
MFGARSPDPTDGGCPRSRPMRRPAMSELIPSPPTAKKGMHRDRLLNCAYPAS